jgi:hypothetical protein
VAAVVFLEVRGLGMGRLWRRSVWMGARQRKN